MFYPREIDTPCCSLGELRIRFGRFGKELGVEVFTHRRSRVNAFRLILGMRTVLFDLNDTNWSLGWSCCLFFFCEVGSDLLNIEAELH